MCYVLSLFHWSQRNSPQPLTDARIQPMYSAARKTHQSTPRLCFVSPHSRLSATYRQRDRHSKTASDVLYDNANKLQLNFTDCDHSAAVNRCCDSLVWTTRLIPEIYSFEIFKNGIRPRLFDLVLDPPTLKPYPGTKHKEDRMTRCGDIANFSLRMRISAIFLLPAEVMIMDSKSYTLFPVHL